MPFVLDSARAGACCSCMQPNLWHDAQHQHDTHEFQTLHETHPKGAVGRNGDKDGEAVRENQRISMRIDLEVLSSFDFVITTSTSDSECV